VDDNKLPNKLFFKIGEVAEIVGVRAHVLRYWETEFAALRPMKTRGSHRVYRRRDVELAMLVRRMLQDDGLTIAGAKRRLRAEHRDRVASVPDPDAVERVDLRAELLAVRRDLKDLLRALDVAANESTSRAPKQSTATVTASVPSTVPISGRSRR
jgi:DNA-binding transcriptional MerR regulator